jgi:hypothetical protein
MLSQNRNKSQNYPLLYTTDLPTSPETTAANFAYDTAVIATDKDPAVALHKLQTSLLAIQHWLKKWRMKANGSKSTHVTFTTRRETCPSVHILNNAQLPQAEVSWQKTYLVQTHIC